MLPLPRVSEGESAMELRMDLPAIDFAPLQETKRTVCLAFSEVKGGFSPVLKELDTQSGGLVTRASAIAKFTGAKTTSLDLLATEGLDIGRTDVFGQGDM